MQNKLKFSLVFAVAIQIALLINMPVANSYQVHQTEKILEKQIEEKDFGEELLDAGLNLLIGFLSIKQIQSVAAQEILQECCLETEQGEGCVDFFVAQENNCVVDLIEGDCSNVALCELGCCTDPDEGTCTTKVTKQNCENSGGEWNSEENCAIAECQYGCCVLGDETQYAVEGRCERLAGIYDLAKDFRQQIKNEIECLNLGASAIKSACIFEKERCERLSEVECNLKEGEYYLGKLCSNPTLNNSCERQDSVGCIKGKDEIYWFDSCGNPENIYSSDKEVSWNLGNLLTKDQSCNPNDANANSQECGNCKYSLGSFCSESGIVGSKIQDGNFICKDINCIDEQGNERSHGESWCVYDGFIGEGKDTVGSRHWKRMCIDGEIVVEACADYRGQICVQGELENPDTNEKFDLANCVMNEASICRSYNSKQETMVGNCQNNSMCYINQVDVDEGFKFEVCVPKYPKGMDLSGESEDYGKEVCGMATQKCTVLYEKKTSGWKCIHNCDCEDAIFGQEMNDLCISMGDCGSYVNYLGDGTDNSVIKKSPPVKWQDYTNYAEVVLGQFAEPKSLDEVLLQHSSLSDPEGYDPTESDGAAINEAIGLLGEVTGGLGTVITGGFAVHGLVTSGAPYGLSVVWADSMAALGASAFGPAVAAIGAFGIMMAAAGIISFALGLEGEAATIMMISGAAVGVYAAVAIWGFGLKLSAACGPFAWICLIILVIIGLLLKVFGIGKTKKVIVELDCLPWEAPTGSDKCSVCNNDPLKLCSKYRCESLGQACKLLNEDTDNPSCESVPNDFKPPIISAGTIESGYEFISEEKWKVKLVGAGGKCIPEFKTVLFDLEIDEPAQCKYEFQPTSNYEEMENYPLELNAYTSNHTFGIMMPSLSSLEIYNLSGDLKQMFGNMNMYVRCQDYYGDKNTREYLINFCIESGPDLTPAYITTSTPRENNYLKYGTTESHVTFYLNEPAECKYDLIGNKSYSEMRNAMDCKTDLEDSATEGWPCSTNLTGLTKEENKFYIKCKDQPWFKNTINETERNINVQDFSYSLYKTNSELKIESISPKGDIETGLQPMSIEFEVITSGGAYSGDSQCFYDFEDYNNMNSFMQTFSNVHFQTINQLMSGPYIMKVKCIDEAGNEARDFVEINIDLDETPPEIIRAYREWGELIITTDERAECYYSPSSCYFDVANSTSMTIGFSSQHRTPWEEGDIYHIKCIDTWGNSPNGCSIRLLPSFI